MATTIIGKVGITPQGEWDAGRADYNRLDWVTYGGSSYMVIFKGGNVPVGTPVTDKVYWEETAKGVDLSSLQYKGSFDSVALAIAGVPLAQRKLGDYVTIKTGGIAIDFSWKNGTADVNLVEYRSTKNDPAVSILDHVLSTSYTISNLFNFSDPTNWVESFGGGYNFSHYINIQGLTHIYMSIKPNGFWHFYNSDKLEISVTTATFQDLVIPTGAVYLRFLHTLSTVSQLTNLTVLDKSNPVSNRPFGRVANSFEEITDLKKTVGSLNTNFTLSNLFNFSDTTNWTESFGGGYSFSHYINVLGMTHIYMSIKPNGFWYWYTAEKTLISATTVTTFDSSVPVNAVYLRFLHTVSTKDLLINLTASNVISPVSGKPFGYIVNGFEDVGTMKVEVEKISDIVDLSFSLSNLFNFSDPTNWIEAFGSGYYYSHYIKVQGLTHIYMSIKPQGFWYWYTSDKLLISSTAATFQDLAVPVNAVYLRFVQLLTGKDLLTNLTVSNSISPVSGRPFGYAINNSVKGYLEDKKYVALGDSITDGDGSAGYTWFHFLLDSTNSRAKAVDFSETGQCLRTMADRLTSTNLADTDKIFVFGGTNQETNYTLGAITDLATPNVRLPLTAYTVGDRVSGGLKEPHGWTTPLYTFNQKYICTVAGTSGSGEPTGFNTTLDSLTVDGTVTWKCEGANTWFGDMRRVVSKIWWFNPSVEIIWFTPIRTRDYVGASQDWRAEKYNAIGAFCDYYGIKNIDLRKEVSINAYTKSALMFDNLHPNLAGQKAIFNALMRNI